MPNETAIFKMELYKSFVYLHCNILTSFDFRYYGNLLDTTWFRLIESTNEAYYMHEISCQSMNFVESRRGGGVRLNSCNYFFFEASGVNTVRIIF